MNDTAMLEGSGVINSQVTINAGATLSPGVGISPGTLTLGSLTLESGSMTEFDLLSPGISDRLQLTGGAGNLTINGGGVRFRDAGGLATGDYPIIDYDGAIQGGGLGAWFNETPFVGPWGIVLVDDPVNGLLTAHVDLSGNKVWTGAASGNWDTTTVNFRTNVPATFANGDVAQFDDTATGTTEVFLPATLLPASVFIDNSDKDYTFSGASIGGPGSLTKQGSGEVLLATVNTYADSDPLARRHDAVGRDFALPLTTDVTVGGERDARCSTIIHKM